MAAGRKGPKAAESRIACSAKLSPGPLTLGLIVLLR